MFNPVWPWQVSCDWAEVTERSAVDPRVAICIVSQRERASVRGVMAFGGLVTARGRVWPGSATRVPRNLHISAWNITTRIYSVSVNMKSNTQTHALKQRWAWCSSVEVCVHRRAQGLAGGAGSGKQTVRCSVLTYVHKQWRGVFRGSASGKLSRISCTLCNLFNFSYFFFGFSSPCREKQRRKLA